MKKSTPITVWEKMLPYIDKAKDVAVQLKSDQYVLYLKDKDKNSNFFFTLKQIDDSAEFTLWLRPWSGMDNTEGQIKVSLNQGLEKLDSWINILKAYDAIVTIYDDPILKSYEQEFSGFVSVDEEDADTAPLDLEKQFYLDDYLTNIKGLLEEKKETFSEEKAKQITEVIQDCEVLQEELPDLTKNQTVKKLATIWAKIRKVSIGLIKEALTEFKKKGIEALAKKVTQDLPDAFDSVMGYLNQ